MAFYVQRGQIRAAQRKKAIFHWDQPNSGKRFVPRAKHTSPDFNLKLRVSRTHLGQVSVAKTPTQVTPLVWKYPTVRGSLWWLMAGNAGENSPALGCQLWENMVLRGSVGASSARFHRASPKGFSVCIRTGQTGRHWPGAWHCSPCPLPALPALMDAGQHPPESRTARPGAVASRRKGWGEKKDGGGGYFQL